MKSGETIYLLGKPRTRCPACYGAFPVRGPGKRKFPIISLCNHCGAHFVRVSALETRMMTKSEWEAHKLRWPKPPNNIVKDHDRVCRRLYG